MPSTSQSSPRIPTVAVALACTLAVASSAGCAWKSDLVAKDNELQQSMKREKALQAEIAQLKKELAAFSRKYDGATELIGELKAQLEKLGQNVDRLMSEKGQLSAGLDDAQKRLEELRKAKAAAEARAAVFRNLIDKLRAMIDAGQLKVTIRNGRMIIVLPNDVLFDSGKTELKQAGKDAIGQVAQVLASIGDRRYLVAGHTDNVPIKTSRFPSNWELSTARAVEVAKLLVAGGMKAESIGAAGYAEFDPVKANDTPENKALNRRIEIILEPNLADLPNLDSLLDGAKK
jgi:chemotaxis protein MotB